MKKAVIVLIVLGAALWLGFSALQPKAPLKDGLYLSYDYGGSTIRVTFKELGGNKFQAAASPGSSEKTVNKRLKTSSGQPYELGLLGPIWISPSAVKVGGNAHGSSVTEVKRWKKWDIGVVKASFGAGGALRGEWYYEKNTGFLVGGSRSTALTDEGDGVQFTLTESNLGSL
jgi:hypothetical protein